MTLRLTQNHVDSIAAHGAREYPNECCGAMLGVEVNGAKEVRELAPLRNLRHDRARAQELLPLSEPEKESEKNRFLIDPEDMLRVERDARKRGLDVVGFYHSHPDHPARPSRYDREHAFPWYSYVIISVEAGKPGTYTSWALQEDRSEFDQELIEVLGVNVPQGPTAIAESGRQG
jgi:proteasome lid subunit RPN8/RPN11